MKPSLVYAIEVSGVCNLESHCVWCPMHNRPRSRKRGIMDDATIDRCIDWVNKLGIGDVLALHNFGEPLLHPKFDSIAKRFSDLVPVTMSTNGVALDEEWADRLAKIPWAWISVSPWKKDAQERAIRLLEERGIKTTRPPGITHNWAGQAGVGPDQKIFLGCHFLQQGKAIIHWDGRVATCCIADFEGSTWGTVFQDPEEIDLRGYSICSSCHHAI